MDNDEAAYRVEVSEGRYRLVDAQGQSLLECRDEASALHYADLMNKAWHSRFRVGYRTGRQAGDGKSLQ